MMMPAVMCKSSVVEEREEANKQALQHLYQQGGQKGLHTLSLKEEEK